MCPAMELVIGSVFDNAAIAAPSHPAVTLGEESLTYGELSQQANQMAHVLAGLGVDRNDRVVTWSDNNLESVSLFVALARSGAVFAPANARLSPEEAVEMAGLARPRLLVVDSGHAEAGQSVADAVGVPLVRLGGTGPGLDLVAEAQSASSVAPALSGVGERDPHVGNGDDGAAVLLHQRQHRKVQRGGAVASVQLASHPHTGAARAPRCHRLHVPDVPHGGVDHRPPGLAGPRAGGVHRPSRR